jgi:hypothetical protein
MLATKEVVSTLFETSRATIGQNTSFFRIVDKERKVVINLGSLGISIVVEVEMHLANTRDTNL